MSNISAVDVAKYFLVRDDREDAETGISNLKLQKLLYYAQGFHLAIFDKPLFSQNIEAWAHGPVVPSVYHDYKQHGKSAIPAPEDFSPEESFTDEQLEFLNEVYEVFGQFSAWKLRNMTHEEAPWQDYEEVAGTIPQADLKTYFKTRIK
ncbi:phage-associated protein [Isoalcanivorax pacificus W11-5]|uniref:Phage-associated protein n=1 Tax=Isoalcanivorax pacificus W11-5 TaxID=391936 RepID=A0A0B4XTY2_9GAMM|nr:type II toxin-antitoxin system antitoxin SocA domain-containing protein [Isoalcanivorax pacificus]AJD49747.1 phage-associated protein [Isoalcanivorax pacificus W11-5]